MYGLSSDYISGIIVLKSYVIYTRHFQLLSKPYSRFIRLCFIILSSKSFIAHHLRLSFITLTIYKFEIAGSCATSLAKWYLGATGRRRASASTPNVIKLRYLNIRVLVKTKR